MGGALKLNINLGATGWQHRHWSASFYPDDLPADWQLTYYSNAFNTVLVPVDYWHNNASSVCAGWLENVHGEFRFFVGCEVARLAQFSLLSLSECLQSLRPQLSALVFLDNETSIPKPFKAQFINLIERLDIEVYSNAESFSLDAAIQVKKIWREGSEVVSNLAFIENDLKDLRAARKIVERFVTMLERENPAQENATIIVDHPKLQPDDLSNFRAVLEIMGY